MKKLLFLTVVVTIAVALTLGPGSTSRNTLRAAEPAPTEIKIFSFIKGTTAYVLSFALTEVLKEHSSWLRGSAISTRGSGENIKMLALKPELRATGLAFAPLVMPYRAMKGKPPFTKPWPTVRALLNWSGGCFGLVTLNPDIKAPVDLVGKKIGIDRKGTEGSYTALNILEYGLGITEKNASLQHLGWQESQDALRDGLLDAAFVLIGATSGPPWLTLPVFKELLAVKPPYFIDIPEEAFKKAREGSGDPITWVKVPPGKFGPNQTKPVLVPTTPLNYWVDASMSAEVVKEILRMYADYSAEFAKFHPAGRLIKAQEIGRIPVPEEMFHPAAVEFYKQRGIPIGLE
ncbi:MAG: TAXI family TRAP transporter solute-binding subunit [Desulfobacterales bacterium]|nr:TAXI family TRAP transporter solute-binding subunit [Desulfobacterales bacterium]